MATVRLRLLNNTNTNTIYKETIKYMIKKFDDFINKTIVDKREKTFNAWFNSLESAEIENYNSSDVRLAIGRVLVKLTTPENRN